MHIPDGYLSPSTCAVAYAAAIPFWAIASRRLKAQHGTKTLPLMSAVSAFSFVVMMFNLPLPGGTTGHAVGMGVAAALLGPWASIIAISVALLIQAVFFGDGGIIAFGANSFNMAIVGSLVAYGVYRLAAGSSEISSPRRIFAAGISGYVGINAAAFATALELGVQPLLFTDAGGAPLYAPYPLSVSIPAMMVSHLLVAGVVEAFAAAGIVAFLQRSNPELLAPVHAAHAAGAGQRGFASVRGFALVIALLMVASPLGLLAAGTAWGEWSAEDFADPAMRAEIAAASGNATLPQAVPSGLEKLSSVWAAPIPDYAPPFMHSEAFGYILSAMLGGGLIILLILALGKLLIRRPDSVGA